MPFPRSSVKNSNSRSRRRAGVLAIVTLASWSVSLGAQDLDGQQIVDRSERLLWGKTFQGELEMSIATSRCRRPPVSTCGLDSPTSGRIWIAGTEIAGLRKAELAEIRLRKIGFVSMASSGPCATFVHEGHRLGSSHVAGFDLRNHEAGVLDERTYRPIQMATATDAFPHRREAVLPFPNPFLRRLPVFDEHQLAVRLHHAAHLAKRTSDIRNRAQRPGSHHRVESAIPERDRFRRCFDERGRNGHAQCGTPSHRSQTGRGLQPDNLPDLRWIEPQIQAGSDTNLEHSTRCRRKRAFSIRQQVTR